MAPRRPIPPQPTPAALWAPPYDELEPSLPTGVVTLTGQASGRATLRFSGTLAGGSFRAHFDAFSDGDGLLVDGEQSLDSTLAFGKFSQSLVASGCEEGGAEASLLFRGRERSGCASAALGSESAAACY
jgi:hypothetical protein